MIDIVNIFDEFTEDFRRKSKVAKGYVSQNTIKTYGGKWNEFIIFLSSSPPSPLEKVTEDQVLAFLEQLRQRQLSSASVKLYLSCLSSVFKFAEKKYGIPDVTSNIEPIKPQTKEIECPSEQEVQILLDFLAGDKKAQKRDYVLFELLVRTGPRVSEISNLNLDDIKITDTVIQVTYLGKGNKKRTIEIPLKREPEIVRFKNSLEFYLSNYRKGWKVNPGSEKAFFLGIRGDRLSSRAIEKVFKFYMKKLKLRDYKVHSLRHFFVTNLLGRGVDVATVAKLVGHANPSITYAIYAHTNPEKIKQAIERAFDTPHPLGDES